MHAVLIALIAATTAVAKEAQPPGPVYAIDVAKVICFDDADTVVDNATVIVSGGKITAVGAQGQVAVPDGATRIDARDKWLVPGLVDAHNHVSGNLMDLNDMVYLTNPGLRTLETIAPDNELIKDARAGGVTSVLLIPGSGTNISGFGTITKTAGRTVDEVVLRSPGSLKVAQAGNPEWYWYGVGRSYMNYNTRQTLLKAKAYHEAMESYERGETAEAPQFNPIFDEFRGLFRREYPASVHTQFYQVLMTTVDMLAKKLDLWTVLDHCTFDAYKVAPLVNETDAFTINGPRQYHFDRAERRMNGNAARWWQGGVRKLGINTDAPVVPQEELSYQAAMACWYGWLPYPALRGVTRVPADALGLSDRTGSIEVGKDADFGLWTGDPLDPRSSCEITFVNGKICYDASIRRRF